LIIFEKQLILSLSRDMRQIILVRHCHTGQRGTDDPGLSDGGREQAGEISGFLEAKDYEFEAVYASLYKRAIETAELLVGGQKKIIKNSAFNEYYVRSVSREEVETTQMAASRAMAKLYSIYDLHESVMLVLHSSIGKTVLHALLNCTYNKSLEYLNKYGEVVVLRYDWHKGDENWKVIDSFIPVQVSGEGSQSG